MDKLRQSDIRQQIEAALKEKSGRDLTYILEEDLVGVEKSEGKKGKETNENSKVKTLTFNEVVDFFSATELT